MPITPQSASEANHPDAIRHELDWLAQARPLWQSDTVLGSTWCDAITPHDTQSIATELANQWAWHGEPRRLGRRFEELMTATLEAIEGMTLLRHSLPIRDGTHTLGEIDYLIEAGGVVTHLEVAIKFYAGMAEDRDRRRLDQWVGPSCQDRLDRKIHHLQSHQLPLSLSDHAAQIFAELKIPTPTQHLGVIYGYLLHPWNAPRQTPDGVNQTDLAYWCAYSDYAEAFRTLSRPFGSACAWRHIRRDQWIGPVGVAPDYPLVPKALPRPEQADCYALLRKDLPFTEALRVYVMPDTFAQKALDASADHRIET